MSIAGKISDEWRRLDHKTKNSWEGMAREDKARYQREKAAYTGPWKVRTNVRKRKDPNSPKKPVPAYFAFSNERRQEVKNNNPTATNGEISRLLSKMWKEEASEELRKQYLDKEASDREEYAQKMKAWRASAALRSMEERKEVDETSCPPAMAKLVEHDSSSKTMTLERTISCTAASGSPAADPCRIFPTSLLSSRQIGIQDVSINTGLPLGHGTLRMLQGPAAALSSATAAHHALLVPGLFASRSSGPTFSLPAYQLQLRQLLDSSSVSSLPTTNAALLAQLLRPDQTPSLRSLPTMQHLQDDGSSLQQQLRLLQAFQPTLLSHFPAPSLSTHATTTASSAASSSSRTRNPTPEAMIPLWRHHGGVEPFATTPVTTSNFTSSSIKQSASLSTQSISNMEEPTSGTSGRGGAIETHQENNGASGCSSSQLTGGANPA